MKLQEIFDKPEKIDWKSKTKTNWTGRFTIDGITYQFDAGDDYFDLEDPKTGEYTDYLGYDVSFSIVRWDESQTGKFKSKDVKYGVTGTGNQIKVFSTVVNALRELIKKQKPHFLSFSADGASRQKLYDQMVKVLSSKFGYKKSKKSSGSGGYTLYRKDVFDQIENALFQG